MNEAHPQLAQGAGQLFKGGFGGLAGQFLGFFDQGADPIGLAPFGAGGAYSLDHLDAATVGYQHGVDRGASRR
ncbi:hypothetical protein D9M72_617610 [compost metagenome]